MQVTSTVATIEYDGLGRRIVKQIGDGDATNSTDAAGDWEATYEYYYGGRRMIEVRNGSNQARKQYVWGTQYIDELVQIFIVWGSGTGGR